MSPPHPTAVSPNLNFQLIFNSALKAYEKRTKFDLLSHPLSAELQACDSPCAILDVIDQKLQRIHQSQRADERLTKWLNPTVNVLYAFSATVGQGIGLVFSPTSVIFAGIGVLLSAAMDVRASQENLIDIFERMEGFFRRLELYTEVSPTPEMIHIIVKIMTEVLFILAAATKEIARGSTRKCLLRLVGRTDMEDALKKLDNLTNQEAWMATAQIWKATHNVDDRVRGVEDKVLDVDNRVAGVGDKVTAVGDKVAVVIDGGEQAKLVAQQTADDVEDMKLYQLRQEFRKWLSPPDPSTNHNIACGAHHKRTAEWFFQGSIFTGWKSTASLLWIHGKPGSGKSILCSTIIQDIISLRERGLASLAYFYFDFRSVNKQNRRNLLSSLVSQLSSQSDQCFGILSHLYLTHDSGAQKPSETALIQCLKKMLKFTDQRPVYIIIDALDECPNTSGMPSPREQVLDLLKELIGLSLPNLHLCVTSRPEIDIRRTLEPLTSHCVSLHEEGGQLKDIVDYITSVVQSDPNMRRWRHEDQNLVIETLSERADGMFRWVFCQLEALRHCFPSSVRHMLEALPETLDETYERILRDINKSKQGHARRLLHCLTVAIRPLRVAELAEVLAIDFGTSACRGMSKLNTGWRWEDQQHAILSTCSSLISIVDKHGVQVVQFSHFSVKEFLTSSRLAGSSADVSYFHIPFEPAHQTLAMACLGVLVGMEEGVDWHNIDDSFPLARYAAKHWIDHAKFEQVSSHLQGGMEELFNPVKPYFATWLRIHDRDTRLQISPLSAFMVRQKRTATPLYYAALCGFYDLVKHLIIKHTQQVNASGGCYVSPLGVALGMEHLDVAQLLCEHGADVDVQDDNGSTPLYVALSQGHRELVVWLRDRGANVDVQDDNGSTPLYVASGKGRRELVEWLLNLGAGPNLHHSRNGSTPLHIAASCRQVEICQVLLKHQGDPNALECNSKTPLHLAVEGEHIGLALLFLQHNADPNALDCHRKSPLHLAVERGHTDLVRLLLLHNADLNAIECHSKTPLHLAVERRDMNIVRLLLQHNADPNALKYNSQTPLHLAVERGHINFARLLLQHKADPSAIEFNQRTSLHLAAERGHINIARLLLEHGVDLDAQDCSRCTALHLALGNDKVDIAFLLLERGAGVDAKDHFGRTVCQVASGRGHHDIVKLLSK